MDDGARDVEMIYYTQLLLFTRYFEDYLFEILFMSNF
jgi:hypothetical protein